MNIIDSSQSRDPFADYAGDDPSSGSDSHIHVRLQQRSGRKCLTTVQGISKDYDLKKIVKECKKDFACNGTVVDHPEYGEVIQLTGDQRNKVKTFLIDKMNMPANFITVHGF